jgi:hypothetical protein
MTPEVWAATGIATSMIGVLLLFAFGAPFRIPTGGVSILAVSEGTRKDRILDKVFAILSWMGLFAVLTGNAMQIFALGIF